MVRRQDESGYILHHLGVDICKVRPREGRRHGEPGEHISSDSKFMISVR